MRSSILDALDRSMALPSAGAIPSDDNDDGPSDAAMDATSSGSPGTFRLFGKIQLLGIMSVIQRQRHSHCLRFSPARLLHQSRLRHCVPVVELLGAFISTMTKKPR